VSKDLIGVDIHLFEFIDEILQRNAEIDHGPQVHIAADAGKAIVI
jgi:hypothetical protein